MVKVLLLRDTPETRLHESRLEGRLYDTVHKRCFSNVHTTFITGGVGNPTVPFRSVSLDVDPGEK